MLLQSLNYLADYEYKESFLLSGCYGCSRVYYVMCYDFQIFYAPYNGVVRELKLADIINMLSINL